MTLAPEDHTQQIPQGGYYSQSAPPAPPAPPTPPLGEGSRPDPKRDRRFGQTIGTALLAAVLASGGTYAATQLGEPSTATSTTPAATATTNPNQNSSPTVVQGNASSPDWSAVAAAVAPSVVSIDVTTQQGSGAGSGVIFDRNGHVLTNNHVVQGATGNGSITVTLSDGRTYNASVVGTDPSTDLAVIKLANAPSDLTPITLGDSEALKVGDPVMAVGNPLGLSGTVTTGIISALNRPVSTGTSNESPFGQQQSGDEVVTNAIQTSAAINPGNSGGALVNNKGELIGINSSIASLGQGAGSQSGNIGIGFAIPVKEAKSIAEQLIKSGKAEHAFLGVSTRDTVVTDGSAKRAGAQVASVSSGTPAANAGLKTGDVIIAVDGQRVDSATALVAQIREMKAGDKTTLTIIRNGSRQDVSVTLAVKPDSPS
jgi:putative serine protease PepD